MNPSLLASVLLSFLYVLSPVLADLNFKRSDFPKNFVFGAGSSAFQIEGAVNEDGRTPSIWDTYTHEGWMIDKSNADVSCDGYHKYMEDVELIGEMGLEAYRFSISWSRLIPYGRGDVNPKGLEFYNNLINALVERGIEIHITIHHVDLPQDLQDEYGGWLSPKIIEDFTAYADVIFREFGDRVSHWTTIIEPNVIAVAGFDCGDFPPVRCSNPFGCVNCTAGNSSVEAYIALHNMLLSHASVAKLYREKYKDDQKGVVGINVFTLWCYPYSYSIEDIKATKRVMDFMFGWVVNPVVYGDYPSVMRKMAGSRLPKFTKNQSELLKGSADFIGINHYTSAYVSDNSNALIMNGLRDTNADMFSLFRMTREQAPTTAFKPSVLPPDPQGLEYLLEYFRDVYGNIPVYVEENGLGEPAGSSLKDSERIQFLSSHIGHTLAAMRNGANVKGYLVWSFMDVFELLWGYQTLYGLIHVDFKDENLPRKRKLSAHWYSDFLKGKNGIKLETGTSSDKYLINTIHYNKATVDSGDNLVVALNK